MTHPARWFLVGDNRKNEVATFRLTHLNHFENSESRLTIFVLRTIAKT
jgi:hypothetical protein